MFGALRKALTLHALSSAAMLAAVGIAQAQQAPPLIPSNAPPSQTILPVGMHAPSAKPAGVALLGDPITSGPTPIQTPTPAPSPDDLKARIDRLEKQNQELIEMLKGLQQRPALQPPAVDSSKDSALSKDDVHKLVNDYLGAKDEQAKDAAAKLAEDPKSYIVGQNLGFKGVWTTGPGSTGYQPWFETEDKAFRIHVGGRFQPDWVLGASADSAVVNGKGGIGSFAEGFNFRRARLQVDGWMYEVVDFFLEYDFANQFSSGQPVTLNPATGVISNSINNDANTFGAPAPTDLWAGINYIPIIGGVRVGNVKPAIGLDHLTSSRFLDFLERSQGFDTYYNRNNGFEPGFMIFNYTENQRLAWQLSATKPNNTLFGWTTGGGEWDYAARITGLPYYEDNGRRMIHIGVGGKYIDHLDQGFANLNTRWLIRQGGPNLQNSVARVNLFGVSQAIINPEFFMNLGPLSVQAEYIGSAVNGVTSYFNQVTGSTPVKIPSTSFYSQTAYIQAMYFLTGESRPYGKTALHGSGAAPTRVVPYRNYFWVPGHGGNCNPFSAGAWQVGGRYCWTDLNSAGINGGTLNEFTLGLNWFLNPNMKFQWNYDIGHRSVAGGTSDGYYYGFGMRMAFDF